MTTEKRTLHDDAMAVTFLRNDFYKKKFHAILGIFLLSLFGIIALASMLIYLLRHPPHPLYFISDPVGKLIQDIPIQDPNMTLDQVSLWAIEAVQKAYSYDFLEYRSELQDAQKYFTEYGWRNYMRGLSASNNLKALTERRYIVIAKVVEPPKLLGQGHMGVPYAYKFSMPLLVMYWYPPFDDKSKFYNPLQITLTIVRQSLLSSYKGLGIVQTNAELITSAPPTQNLSPNP